MKDLTSSKIQKKINKKKIMQQGRKMGYFYSEDELFSGVLPSAPSTTTQAENNNSFLRNLQNQILSKNKLFSFVRVRSHGYSSILTFNAI